MPSLRKRKDPIDYKRGPLSSSEKNIVIALAEVGYDNVKIAHQMNRAINAVAGTAERARAIHAALTGASSCRYQGVRYEDVSAGELKREWQRDYPRNPRYGVPLLVQHRSMEAASATGNAARLCEER